MIAFEHCSDLGAIDKTTVIIERYMVQCILEVNASKPGMIKDPRFSNSNHSLVTPPRMPNEALKIYRRTILRASHIHP